MKSLYKFWINLKYVWNIRKPLMMLRVAKSLLLALLGKSPLRYVDLAIGYRCNLSCAHCFAADKIDPKRGRIPPSYFAKVAKECMELGAVNFSFQGGEPLFYDDLKDYIKAAQPSRNLISVTTNGTLLTYEKAKELKSWGVDIITLSLDKYRDNDYFYKAFDNARKVGLKVTIGFVLSKPIGSAFFKLHTKGIIVLGILPIPIGKLQNQDCMLTADEIKVVRQKEKINSWFRTDLQANYLKYGCGAAKEILYLNPYGDVFCCPFIPIPFGNIKHKSIKAIREDMLKIPYLKEYHQKCLAGEDGGIWKKF